MQSSRESMEWVIALSPMLGLALNVFFQVAIVRYRIFASMLVSVFVGFSLGLICEFFTSVALLRVSELTGLKIAGVLLLNTLTYALLGYSYFHFINLGETARRIRILREFVEAGSMTEAQLLARYSSTEMLDLRIGRLVRAGQLAIAGDGALLIRDRTVLRMAKCMVALKRLFLGNDTSDFLKRE